MLVAPKKPTGNEDIWVLIRPMSIKKGNLIITVGDLQSNKLMAVDCRVFKPRSLGW